MNQARIPRVHTVVAADADYGAACRLRNPALALRPSIIAYPYGEREVGYAVNWAKDRSLPIAIRSGGHDYEGFSSNDGGIVIDTSRCDDITISDHGHRCIVGPGANLRKLYHRLFNAAGVTLPGGTCGTVAVGGLALGGGIGHLSRRFGLLCDRLRRIRLIDAGGSIRDSHDDSAGDLLWAARGGGGGNFGVVTEFEFETVSVPAKVVVYSLNWPWGEALIATLLRAFGPWAAAAPREMSASLVVTGRAAGTVHLFGQSLLSSDATAAVLSDLSNIVAPAKSHSISSVSFLDAAEFFAGADYAAAAWKMASSFARGALADDAASAMIEQLRNPPIATTIVQIDALGGAISDIAPSATAFPHRSMAALIQYQAQWNDPREAERGRAWITEIFGAVDPYTSGASYRNYTDLDLKDWERRYYASNYPRLQKLKKRLDPKNLFRFAQSIRSS